MSIGSPTNITYNSHAVSLNVSANETVDTWVYELNGVNITFTPNTTITALEGSNSIRIYARDNANNLGSSLKIVFSTHVVSVDVGVGGGGGGTSEEEVVVPVGNLTTGLFTGLTDISPANKQTILVFVLVLSLAAIGYLIFK